jgi:hypothetical protein
MSSVGAPRIATPDLASAMRDLVRYRQEHLTGDEKGEGQIFLEHLFQAFRRRADLRDRVGGLRDPPHSRRLPSSSGWAAEARLLA